MPNRDHWRGFRGGEAGPRGRDEAGSSPERGSESRSFRGATPSPARPTGGDPGFRVEDARLNAALDRYERERGGRRADYGHDQNYLPGYHEGGSRFGFFSLGGDAEPERARGSRPEPYRTAADQAFDRDIDQDLDPDYLHWRAQQMARHDRDYADWRRHQREQYDEEYRRFRAERRDDFHQRFQDWRAQRDAEASAAATPPEDKI